MQNETEQYVPARERFERTKCACSDCAAHCKTRPGFLSVSDKGLVEWWLGQFDMNDPEKLANDSLVKFRASVTTKVLAFDSVIERQAAFWVPTITPNVHPDGSGCVFLLLDGKCDVWDKSPYGCSHFDSHMGFVEGNKRMQLAVNEIVNDIRNDGPYWDIWSWLRDFGSVTEELANLAPIPTSFFRERLLRIDGK